VQHLDGNSLTLTLPPQGLAVFTVSK
jgi:hypothetical protein